jgi:hypothetical protein
MNKLKMTILLVLVIALFGVTSAWCVDTEEYKSMCELHPKECAKGSLGKLGEAIEQSDGNKYRVIAEAKSTINPVWVQFIDTCPIKEEFDGKCNFVVFFMLKEDGFYGEAFSCAEAIAMIIIQCKTEGIEYDDYVIKGEDYYEKDIDICYFGNGDVFIHKSNLC